MMSRKAVFGLSFFLALLPWSGCTSPTNNNPGNATPTPRPGQSGDVGWTGGTPVEMDEEVRAAAIEAAGQRFQSLLDQSEWAAGRQQMVDFLKSQPEYKAAGIFGTEVYAEFLDGVMMLFIDNFADASLEETAAATTAKRRSATASFLPSAYPMPGADHRGAPAQVPVKTGAVRKEVRFSGIPQSPTCYVAHALGTCFDTTVVAGISGELARLGYTEVSAGNLATVEDLKSSVKDIGVFYLATHGGGGIWHRPPDESPDHPPEYYPDGSPFYSVWTATALSGSDGRIDPALLRTYWNELSDGSLTLGWAKVDRNGRGDCTVECHLCFTGRFVKRHMTFSSDSFVFISACDSLYYEANELLVPAFFDKRVGASAYAGWQEAAREPATLVAAAFLFDRLLGANSLLWGQWPINGSPLGVTRENPPQRPFDYVSLLKDMRTRNPRLDMGINKEKRQFFLGIVANPAEDGGDFGLLAPSIEGVFVDAQKDQLHLTGWFGYKQGRVTMSGESLNVLSWGRRDVVAGGPDEIICDLPRDTHGDITVYVDDRPSNTVQLTQWELKMIAKATRLATAPSTGQHNLSIEVTLKFRACLNDFRHQPHLDPQPRPSVFTALSRTSTGKIEAAGEIYTPPNQFGNGESTATALPPDRPEFRVVYQNETCPTDDPCYLIESDSYVVSTSSGRGLKLHVEASGYWCMRLETDQGTSTGCTNPIALLTNAFFDTAQPIQIQMDENYAILGSDNPIPAKSDSTATLEWLKAEAQSPPKPDAAR